MHDLGSHALTVGRENPEEREKGRRNLKGEVRRHNLEGVGGRLERCSCFRVSWLCLLKGLETVTATRSQHTALSSQVLSAIPS